MKLTDIQLVATAAKPGQFPEDSRPEIALAGRSNVGKSSLINTVINRRGLARTSADPGKTRTLNFYLVNDSFYLVDLPGYGFARVSQHEREEWRKLIEAYLSNRQQLVGALQIVDIRHNPSETDKRMLEALQAYRLPVAVVATKADKIARGKQKGNLERIANELKLTTQVICFSAKTRSGKDLVWQAIKELLEQPPRK